MHGRSHMTVDPRIPNMLGRSMSGFHRPGECVWEGGMRVGGWVGG